MKDTAIHSAVREGYSRIARQESICCKPSCCAPKEPDEAGRAMGYSAEDLQSPAAQGNLNLGCGNPGAIANLKAGETVVDLGSGAGFDALLAAPKLGATGRFIGIDMTPEMLARARTNAVNQGYAETVEFREGLIEDLPVASETVDVVISNCVINLSPDKRAAFREAHRILKPGGRLAVSDILLSAPLPDDVVSASLLVACLAGAETEEEYIKHIEVAGFVDIEFERQSVENLFELLKSDPTLKDAVAGIGEARAKELASTAFSYTIRARKP